MRLALVQQQSTTVLINRRDNNSDGVITRIVIKIVHVNLLIKVHIAHLLAEQNENDWIDPTEAVPITELAFHVKTGAFSSRIFHKHV